MKMARRHTSYPLAASQSAIPTEPGAVALESVPLVQAHTRWVRQKVDVGVGWSAGPDVGQQSIQQCVAEPSPLVRRQHRHVDDVEVPATVTDHPAHPNDLPRRPVDGVHGRPPTRQRRLRLASRPRRKSGLSPQRQVVRDRRGRHHQAVVGVHRVRLVGSPAGVQPSRQRAQAERLCRRRAEVLRPARQLSISAGYQLVRTDLDLS